jgi:hypothetical protein
MAYPHLGPYTPYTYQHHAPWSYQRSYPYPGFRQTGACPQHGVFYGHGGCFQLPHTQPAAPSLRSHENVPYQITPAAVGLSPSAQQLPTSTGTGAFATPSHVNMLSARAETFIPINTQEYLFARGFGTATAKDNHLAYPPMVQHQFEMGRNPPVSHDIAAPIPTERKISGPHDTSTNIGPCLSLTARHHGPAKVEPSRAASVHHTLAQNISSVVSAQQHLRLRHQISFPHFQFERLENVKSLNCL